MNEGEQNPQSTISIFPISPSLHPFYSTLIISPPAPRHSLHLLSPLRSSLHLVSPASSSFYLKDRNLFMLFIYLFIFLSYSDVKLHKNMYELYSEISRQLWFWLLNFCPLITLYQSFLCITVHCFGCMSCPSITAGLKITRHSSVCFQIFTIT